MMPRTNSRMVILLTFLIGACAGAGAILYAQATAAQTERFPQFENQTVKVWRTVVPAHSQSAMHRHDHPRIIVPLADGTMKLVEASGESTVNDWQRGKAYWQNAMAPGATHADVNPGNGPVEVMVIELLRAN